MCYYCEVSGVSPYAPVAQPVEHLTFNQGVRSSILRRSTKTAGIVPAVFLFVFICTCTRSRFSLENEAEIVLVGKLQKLADLTHALAAL